MFAVIADNDESQWHDDTGVLYHFPRRYKDLLSPGTEVVYYKGRMNDRRYEGGRLTSHPHYFGRATVGDVYTDPASSKGDLFAVIEGYQPFTAPVSIKDERGAYLELIPPNRQSNYWRDGVRQVSQETYSAILLRAKLVLNEPSNTPGPTTSATDDLESGVEGTKNLRYVTTYERDPKYRRQALAIHGYRCKGCETTMAEMYGPYAEGLIHVHHVVPVSTFEAPKKINPATDLVPLCPNCHAVVHRKKVSTLAISELRDLVRAK